MLGFFIFVALLAIIPSVIADSKGRNAFLWYIYGFFFFLIALIHSLCMKHAKYIEGTEAYNAEHKDCLHCGEKIKKRANVCSYCGGKQKVEAVVSTKEPVNGWTALDKLANSQT